MSSIEILFHQTLLAMYVIKGYRINMLYTYIVPHMYIAHGQICSWPKYSRPMTSN